MITITKGEGTYSRQKTDENGVRLNEIENIEYDSKTYHVTDGESMWLVSEKLFSIIENKIYQGENLLVEGEIIKTNF